MICFTRKSYVDLAKLYLEDLRKNLSNPAGLDKYGKMGVEALRNATPKDSSRAANSWRYEIIQNGANSKIVWHNDDIEGGYNVAILIQYGHGTKSGTYVEGIDFINPALAPVFDAMRADIEREVVKR